MSSNTLINGENIVFTSRSSNSVITLKPEAGKTLNIEGYGTGSSLTSTKTISYPEFNASPTVLSTVDVSVNDLGTKIAIAKSANYIIASAPLLPTDGGGVVFFHNGSSWVEQQILTSAFVSSAFLVGNVAINEAGDRSAMVARETGTGGSSGIDLYSRTGTSWTLTDSKSDFDFASLSGTRALLVENLSGPVTVFQNGVSEQVLQAGPAAVGVIATYGAIAGSLAVIENSDDNLSVFTRASTTWTLQQTLYAFTEDLAFTAIDAHETVIVASTPQRVYIWEYANSTFSLTATIAETSITSVSLSPSGKLLVYKTNEANIFVKDSTSGSWFYSGTETLATDTSVKTNDTYAVISQPTVSAGQLTVHTYGATATSTLVSSVVLDDEINITSVFPINMSLTTDTTLDNPTLSIVGDQKISGQLTVDTIRADTIHSNERYGSEHYRYLNTTAQTITTATLTQVSSSHWTEGVSSPELTVPGVTRTGGVFTITRAGIFIITASVGFTANATGSRRLILCKNDVTTSVYGDSQIASTSAGIPCVLNVSAVVLGVVGDVFQTYVYQDSGGNLDILGSIASGITRYFQIARISDRI